MKTKPNILWICSDQQRWDSLGCHGNEFVATPNIDQLAGQGTLFENAFVQNPLCTPSRASFLTGRYPRTARCYKNGQSIPPDEVLATRLLAEQGYTCGLSGKLHLSACQPKVCPGEEPRINDGYKEFYWSHHACLGMREANQYRQWLEAKGETFRWEQHPECPSVKYGMPDELHQTTWCAEKAIDFMRAHAGDDEPWLFSVNMFDPHHAFDPPRERFERYLERLDEIPAPRFQEGELDNKPPYQAKDHDGAHGGSMPPAASKLDAHQQRLIRAAYWAMCDLIDDRVGAMVRVLEETGQLENTIVIFMSDHGEMLGDHGIYLKGPYLYDELMHVPLIISQPGTIQAQRASALVEMVDLAPTLLEAAGVPAHPGMQGRSLWPMIAGQAKADHHRDDVYGEFYDAMDCHRDPVANLSMIRDHQYKLVADHTHASGELYDLREDPHEHVNLWDAPDRQSIKSALLLRLCNRMAETVDPLPPRLASW